MVVQLPSLYPSFDDKVPIINSQDYPTGSLGPPLRTTTTTTIFTPGNNKLEQAMQVKMVADELLAATGTVVGTTLALFASPGAVYLGASSGEQAGRNIGNVMWRGINWLMDDRSLSQQYNRGQQYGDKGYQPQDWV